jgi:hypothetical protein
MSAAAASTDLRRGAVNKNPSGEKNTASAMELDTGLSQDVAGLHLLPPGLTAPSTSSGLPAGFEARHVPVGGRSDSEGSDSPRSVIFTAPPPEAPETIWLPCTFMQDLFETAVLLHFEVVKAASAVSGDCIGLVPKQMLTGWPPVLAALNGLAYSFNVVDPWCRLGLLPHAGQKPSEFLIEQRFAVASTFLSASSTPSWTSDDKSKAAEALSCLEEARSACLELLPSVLRDRARDPRFVCPRWAELGQEALQAVAHAAPALDEIVATQLSDVLGLRHRLHDDRILLPDDARDLTSRLALDPGRALASIHGSGLVCWAPADAAALGRLLSAYMQHAADVLHPRSLRLVVPLDTLPGCSSATGIMDLWSHPLLMDKWKPIVRRVEFTSQALQVVLSGAVAPTTSSRTLMIATVSASYQFAPPSVLSVSEPLFQADRSHGIRVDCLVSDLMRVRRSLAVALSTRPVQWTDPARSPGSTTTAPRVYLTGYLPPLEVTALDLHLIFANLRNYHLPSTALVASEALFANNAAMIIEVTDPAAAFSVVALCEEMAFISPRALTVTSLAACATWEDRLEHTYAEDPACFVSKLRWRRSRNGGRSIAQPAATQRQMQASQRVATAAPRASSAMADITINGSLGHNGRMIELQVIKVLTDRGLALQERAATAPSVAGSWLSVASSTSAGPSGRLQVHLASEEELEEVRLCLHDRAFQMGCDMISLTITDDTALALQAKNGRRGARSRASPSGNAAPSR